MSDDEFEDDLDPDEISGVSGDDDEEEDEYNDTEE